MNRVRKKVEAAIATMSRKLGRGSENLPGAGNPPCPIWGQPAVWCPFMTSPRKRAGDGWLLLAELMPAVSTKSSAIAGKSTHEKSNNLGSLLCRHFCGVWQPAQAGGRYCYRPIPMSDRFRVDGLLLAKRQNSRGTEYAGAEDDELSTNNTKPVGSRCRPPAGQLF